MSASLGVGAALLLGLLASGHCVLMCGGISLALGAATARGGDGRPRRHLLVAYQVGRVGSYALIGFLAGWFGHAALAWLDVDALRGGLRWLIALVLLVSAGGLLGVWRNPAVSIGTSIWPRLAALGRRLLPVDTLPRAFGFGMIWGWLPCGFVYNVLIVAALTADPRQSALLMLMFGVGTLPAMLAGIWGGQRVALVLARPASRRCGAGLLVGMAVLVVLGPWLLHALPRLHAILPFDCGLAH